MKPEVHIERIRESLRAIRKAIEDGASRNQRTIGFHVTAVMVDMLELYLHKLGLLDVGAQLKHLDFRSSKIASKKLAFDFPRKEEIIKLMIELESMRTALCYGAPKSEEIVSSFLEKFWKLKEIFEEVGALDEL